MLAMYARSLELPKRSFFLFGPRGTGKTTWLRAVLPEARSHWFDLILDRELLRLTRDPDRFTQEIEALPAGSWVVVDEVQKLPSLLNRVQDLISRHGARRYLFALTGSSARKLKRGGVNLLPGRVVNRAFFPLTAAELGGDFDLEDVLRFGSLPAVWGEGGGAAERIDLLEAYVQNYLTQEVRAEALVKDLEPFTRFLDVAALTNGQVTNVAAVSRDAAVARPTVQGYFEILIDTLIGFWLPAWRPRAKVKEVGHPKFYLFDPGVVRAITGQLRDPLSDTERGTLLETYVLHELRAWMNVSACGGQLSYWRTPSGSEVDFVWTRASRACGVEVKASRRWRREDGAALRQMVAEGVVQRGFGVYLGDAPLKDGAIEILPLAAFLARLAAGKVLAA
jgi:predicted AAA+ superfamily ATPase